MKLDDSKIALHNQKSGKIHNAKFEFLKTQINDCESIISKLIEFQIAIPSWALGNGGTRFGRFAGGGEPRNLEEKIEDVGLMNKLNQSGNAISLHIPWDIPKDYQAIRDLAKDHGLRFDAM